MTEVPKRGVQKVLVRNTWEHVGRMDGFQASSNFIEDLVVLIDTGRLLKYRVQTTPSYAAVSSKKIYVGGIEHTTNPSKVASNGIYDCNSL